MVLMLSCLWDFKAYLTSFALCEIPPEMQYMTEKLYTAGASSLCSYLIPHLMVLSLSSHEKYKQDSKENKKIQTVIFHLPSLLTSLLKRDRI